MARRLLSSLLLVVVEVQELPDARSSALALVQANLRAEELQSQVEPQAVDFES